MYDRLNFVFRKCFGFGAKSVTLAAQAKWRQQSVSNQNHFRFKPKKVLGVVCVWNTGSKITQSLPSAEEIAGRPTKESHFLYDQGFLGGHSEAASFAGNSTFLDLLMDRVAHMQVVL